MTDENTRSELLSRLSANIKDGEQTIAKGVSADHSSGVETFKQRCWNNRDVIIAALRQPDQNKNPVSELVERLKSMAYVSGVARCAKCGFQLIKSNLNVSAGTVTAGEATGEICPNDGSTMWQVSYRDWSEENEKAWEGHLAKKEDEITALAAENERLREAVKQINDNEMERIVNAACDTPDADLIWVLDIVRDEVNGRLSHLAKLDQAMGEG